MTKEGSYTYIWFPISYLRALPFDITGTIDKIAIYGLTKLAIKYIEDAKEDDVMRCLIYALYRRPETITNELNNLLSAYEFGCVGMDEDYEGFILGKFSPEEEYKELRPIIRDNPSLYREMTKLYGADKACYAIGLKKTPYAISQILNEIDSFVEPSGVRASAKLQTILDLQDSRFDDEFFIAQLVFIAIKSIVGTKKFVKTNWEMIIARTLGFANYPNLKEFIAENGLKEEGEYIRHTLSKRRQRDNIITNLQYHHRLKYYSAKGIRGFYISFDSGLTPEKLEEIARLSTMRGKKQAIKARRNES